MAREFSFRLKGVGRKDLLTSLLLLGVAGFFALSALRNLKIGTANAMGPGFFPLMIASFLGVLAVLVGIRAFKSNLAPGGIAGPRAFLFILGGPLVFAVLIAPLGFVPAIALCTFFTSWSSQRMKVGFALAVTLTLTLLSTLLFVYLLEMPVTLFGTWLGI
jgi:hypothetical protein